MSRLFGMGLRVLLPLLLLISTVFAQSTSTSMLADPIGLRNFAISDDGKDVYFAAYRNPDGTVDQGSNIYRYQGSVGTTTKLTNFKTDGVFLGAMHVAYPGTGTRVAYTVLDTKVPSEDQVRLYDTATGNDRLLDTYKDDCARILCLGCLSTCIHSVHMTRDGGTVFYAASATDATFYTIKADGTGRTKLPVYQGSIAPSGQRVISDNGKVVFTSAAPHGPTLVAQANDVYVMNLDGTNIQQLTHLTVIESASNAVISADGTRVAFVRDRHPCLGSCAARILPAEIWTVRTDGTDLRRLSDGGKQATNPSISADGSTVTFIQDNQVKKITTILDILALFRVVDLTYLSISVPHDQVLSGNGQQAAIGLNHSAIYLAPAGDVTTQVVGLGGFTRVYTPRVLYSWGILSPGLTAGPSVGSLMTAFGANLGTDELTVNRTYPLATNIDGVELLMNGTPLPIQATTPWQINAHIPQSTTPGEVGFVARGGSGRLGAGTTTSEVRVDVDARDPEVIPMANTDRMQAAAVYPGTAILADKEHPASPGQVLEVYIFGLGVTIPRVAGGVASPSNPPATADVRPRISIGDREAEILFSGLAPGLAGVYQVNLRVPSGMRPNPQKPGFQQIRWIGVDSPLSVAGIYVQE